MSIANVRAYFKQYNKENDVIEFETSSATVELAARAVGTEEARIAKTLSFMTPEGPILIVTAGDTKIDNKSYKAQFSCKAKMLTMEEVEKLVGHKVGGVCPFAIKDGVDVYLDNSMKRFDSVFPAAGSSNSAIELNCEELEKFSQSFKGWIDVCVVR
ncbi:YbaK/EbsC family protein [Peptostreptococcus sp. D1]|uniref:YbaK/EbsC family protein n=1 Tax=Peptostreptococcus sp. D1 TaxID=72304 RepID=UPI0008E78DE3|nr:YbaK/EbsC family protein [Peptostreptococcus sp. D1]SFE44663.1 Cys-tRNA(Pro) deacylase, prolyl-tRNA editing enzyme YbaK/EbsC [Peptostreptococcus sp. D1]